MSLHRDPVYAARRTAPAAGVLDYQPRRPTERTPVLECDPLRNLWLPLILLIVGCAAAYLRLRWFGGLLGRGDPVQVWMLTGRLLVRTTAAMLLTAYLLARCMGIGFGPLVTATVKLAGIAAAPFALVLGVQLVLGGGAAALLLGMLLAIPLAWCLFMYLFDHDPQEALICVGATMATRWLAWLSYLLLPF